MSKLTGKPRNLYRYTLLTYPTLNVCPLDVTCFIFGQFGGHGFMWSDEGEVIELYPRKKLTKSPIKRTPQNRYSDLEKDGFYEEDDLAFEAQKIQYRFIKKNMKRVLDSGPTATYFSKHSEFSCQDSIVKDIHLESMGLKFPDNIKPEWCRIVIDFLHWWPTKVASHYGMDSQAKLSDAIKHWPSNIQKAYKIMLRERKRATQILYGEENLKKAAADVANIWNGDK